MYSGESCMDERMPSISQSAIASEVESATGLRFRGRPKIIIIESAQYVPYMNAVFIDIMMNSTKDKLDNSRIHEFIHAVFHQRGRPSPHSTVFKIQYIVYANLKKKGSMCTDVVLREIEKVTKLGFTIKPNTIIIESSKYLPSANVIIVDFQYNNNRQKFYNVLIKEYLNAIYHQNNAHPSDEARSNTQDTIYRGLVLGF